MSACHQDGGASAGASLRATIRMLDAISAWPVSGSFEYRMLGYNPGFSLVAVNPSARDGRFIVEFHAFHNEATSSRMHIEIGRKQSDHWYTYWRDQFERIWDAASAPATSLSGGDERHQKRPTEAGA